MSHRHLSGSDLHFGYERGFEVLRGADLDVAPGSRVALLGANGSGKSTLLQCLAGTLRPNAGEISLDGRPIDWSRRGLRAHRQAVQLVFQDPDDQLFSADVAEDVAYGPVNLGLSATEVRERVDRALDLLHIADLRNRPTHQLSFGQRKRVAIAGAVAMRPCVLLLDEPTAGIDPAGVDALFDTLAELERADTTVALSTHDTALALEWADSVAVISAGSTRQDRPSTIFSDTGLLRDAQLKPPWLTTLARDLVLDGILPPDVAPTTPEQLRAALRSAVAARRGAVPANGAMP
ncbi:energy-coupling factor ABC transporter ATP-binding protein [Mycobacterium sp. SMC-4]|uniref:energy-coupling factor ABC transporter ATP-binding protein n=1 Tax=Mycobacterium sp. SMC-4 TaxID=2857059 RepID=UPI003CFECAA1